MSQVICSICSTPFEPHFRYQREVSTRTDETGTPHEHVVYFCTQRCLEASHHQRDSGLVGCAACAREFQVTLALQIVFTGGKRNYACSETCRKRVLGAARAIRLGEFMDPRHTAAAEATAASELIQETSKDFNRLDAESQASLEDPPEAVTALPRLGERHERGQPAPARQAPSARVIAVFNHKGGTAKTTTAVSISAGLASAGQRVLLVDTDSQGNVATSLHLKSERSLYHVIVMGLEYQDAIVTARPGLDVLTANETLAAAELYLSGRKNRDRVLTERLGSARSAYDFIIVDCSPSLNLLNQNALVMSDEVLCPVACDYLSLVGVRQVLRTLRHVNQFLRHPVQLWGVLPTLYDGRARVCREAHQTLQEHFGARCLNPVHHAAKVKEAPSLGKTLFEYAPDSPAMADYQAVVHKLINDTGSTCKVELRAGGEVA
ncbi:MAG TPA: ParA family protein [Polyangiaceae bacterium]|nr:ParA family protein [Polyangiaceae bacterium]